MLGEFSSPLWVFNLLGDKVESVPAGVGEQSRVQGQSNVSRVLRGAFKEALEVLSVTWWTKKTILPGLDTSTPPLTHTLWCSEETEGFTEGLRTLSNLQQAGDNDGDEGNDFGVGEEVLHPGSPLHIGTVHEG